MSPHDKPLVWLRGEVKTPPLSDAARVEAGFLLRRLQRGELLGLPASRPMPTIGSRCHELRVRDGEANWRVMYHLADDAVVVLDVFAKKTGTTPKAVLDACLSAPDDVPQGHERNTRCALRRNGNWNAPDGLLVTSEHFSDCRLRNGASLKRNSLSRMVSVVAGNEWG